MIDLIPIEFRNLRDFERGTIYNLLKEAYSFDEKYVQADGAKWENEADGFFFDNLSIADLCVFITVIGDEPIGVVMWDPRKLPEEATIGHNCIIPRYKGYGYGKAQMQEAVKRILQQGAKRITVSTNADLMPARRMYASVGFKEIGRMPAEGFFDDWIFYEYPIETKS